MHRLNQLVQLLDPFLKHKDSCTRYLSWSNPASDYCSCGLADMRKEANEIVKQLAKELNNGND